jgi:sigma-54 dependent transcriptional regulator, acetoin dehydrogenase operon transcriptional activator AcoR
MTSTSASARIIGSTPSFIEVVQKAALLASVSTPVLLTGETGVGKDVFARFIHEVSPDRNGPFIALNCGGLPRDLLSSELFGYTEGAFTGARRSGMVGKIEAAHGGTLFLDEIAEMPLDLQPYLLRVLENFEVCPVGSHHPRKVRFRLIAACNRDLQGEVEAGRFRMDLYYRVSVTALRIPPLRERAEDIPLLIQYFAREVTQRHSLPEPDISPDVVSAFTRYHWPGNVRELRNVLEALILLSHEQRLEASMLPAELQASRREEPARPTGTLQLDIEQLEAEAIRRAIRVAHGNLTQAARTLRIARSTLYLKIKKYGLDPIRYEQRISTRALGPDGDPFALRMHPPHARATDGGFTD